jgi:hypothetical protein
VFFDVFGEEFYDWGDFGEGEGVLRGFLEEEVEEEDFLFDWLDCGG